MKLPKPFGYYFKSMKKRICPLCQSDNISVSSNKEVVWCDGYMDGTYVSAIACETYASDGDGHCKYCVAGGFFNRHYPNELVMVCEDCRKAINFSTLKVSDILF